MTSSKSKLSQNLNVSDSNAINLVIPSLSLCSITSELWRLRRICSPVEANVPQSCV